MQGKQKRTLARPIGRLRFWAQFAPWKEVRAARRDVTPVIKLAVECTHVHFKLAGCTAKSIRDLSPAMAKLLCMNKTPTRVLTIPHLPPALTKPHQFMKASSATPPPITVVPWRVLKLVPFGMGMGALAYPRFSSRFPLRAHVFFTHTPCDHPQPQRRVANLFHFSTT